jgi:uncharacterized OB-fold protein
MKEYKKPLPQPTPWSKPFWDGCKRHELLIQKCKDCQQTTFYPKLFCPNCLSPNLEWVKASGRGVVYTFTLVQSYQPTEFSEDVPYIVAVINLEEGVRMMSNIVQCDPKKVKCDMEVEVVFDQITPEFTLPKFRPIS